MGQVRISLRWRSIPGLTNSQARVEKDDSFKIVASPRVAFDSARTASCAAGR